ncbi:hypothetical protein SAMN05216474_1051 [Lishizhenia tianjinensis]|uniref:Outer membrane protein beta-barrel domain-containing protein n=1 Tax=Lishizhenia tianjinensis TaxID=477690 RepID=A0A1I6YNM4_9FLAO|nr:hypothetical protein [Lishizhenia tianjinensis]SFT52076.1 hypothetical protein SAMN05216474_1051 [Lishizhenia tianjinensis]
MNKSLNKSLLLGLSTCLLSTTFAQNSLSKIDFHFGSDVMFMDPLDFENTGNDFIRSNTTMSPNFQFGWSYPVHKNLELGVNANFVFPSMNLGFEINDEAEHQMVDGSGEKIDFLPFQYENNSLDNPTIAPELYVKYKLPFLTNNIFHISGGVMLWFDKPEGNANLLGAGSYSVGSNDGPDYTVLRYEEYGREDGPSIAPSYFLELGYEHKRIPGLLFKARYNHSNHVFRTGTYEFYNFDVPTYGTFSQIYSYYSLGLQYTINKDRKRAKKAYLRAVPEGGLLKNRQSERAITEGTYLVSAGMGASFLHDVLSGGEEHFETKGRAAFSWGMNVERVLAKNFYGYFNYSFQYLKHGFNINREASYGSQFGVEYNSSYELAVGGGYRVVGPKNYNYINVNLGLVQGFTTGTYHDTMTGTYQVPMSQIAEGEIWRVDRKEYVERQVLTALRVGVSKDLKLSRNAYFSIAYNYQFGLYKHSQNDMTYLLRGDEQPYTASIQSKGSRSSLMFSLKYRVNNRVKRRPLGI